MSLKKGIAIASAKRYANNNVYPARNRWEDVISKNRFDIDVVVNEEIINWLIGMQIDYDSYFINVIGSACRIEVELVRDGLNQSMQAERKFLLKHK